ncbi:hypothetical protein DCAR_0830795 [Daucus carota subsp. sativus]|uniref:Pectinesterase n=1 Tax=Daucus carota subsp. sativus TaxID=79200 RepID=A0AAF1B9H1_DAUCS|nr:hypothetical protein DCAR_0830795 [Daucus carota subsp. sativus]
MYRDTIDGYQDTLYTHSFRKFYRECEINGTIDYIFGNAAVMLQDCNIVSKMPLPGQFTAKLPGHGYGYRTRVQIQESGS